MYIYDLNMKLILQLVQEPIQSPLFQLTLMGKVSVSADSRYLRNEM